MFLPVSFGSPLTPASPVPKGPATLAYTLSLWLHPIFGTVFPQMYTMQTFFPPSNPASRHIFSEMRLAMWAYIDLTAYSPLFALAVLHSSSSVVTLCQILDWNRELSYVLFSVMCYAHQWHQYRMLPATCGFFFNWGIKPETFYMQVICLPLS